MNPAFLLLPLAILVLWTPAAAISSSEVKERLRKPIRRRDEGLASLTRCGLNWIDLARGAFGGWLIQHEVLTYHAGQDDLGMVHTVVLYSVLLVAVLAQMIWIDRPVRIIGPAFFFTGLTLAVSGPMIGGFALLLGITCGLMLRRLSLAFVFVPVGLVAFSLLFDSFSALILFNAAIFALPTMLAFALGARVAYVRRPAGSRGKGAGTANVAAADAPDDASLLGPRLTSARAKAAGQGVARPAAGLAAPKVIELGIPQVAGQKRSA
jgi:hypothetical protein